jgi:hypothetical protein
VGKLKGWSIQREVKLRDVEVFLLREAFVGKAVCYMVLVDMRRASSLADYPYLIGIEGEEEFGRRNYIKVIFISKYQFLDDEIEEVVQIAGGFLENKEQTDWNCCFEVIDPSKFQLTFVTREDQMRVLDEVLAKYGIQVGLSRISKGAFRYLAQD